MKALDPYARGLDVTDDHDMSGIIVRVHRTLPMEPELRGYLEAMGWRQIHPGDWFFSTRKETHPAAFVGRRKS